MRVAPYSYDLIDNLGERSAQTRTPGADDLEVGMAMMVFRITSFEPGVHFSGLTLPQAEKLYGKLAVTYLVCREARRRAGSSCESTPPKEGCSAGSGRGSSAGVISS